MTKKTDNYYILTLTFGHGQTYKSVSKGEWRLLGKFWMGHLMKSTRSQFTWVKMNQTDAGPLLLQFLYRCPHEDLTFNMSSHLPAPCGMNSHVVDRLDESAPITQDHLITHQYDPFNCAIHLIGAAFGIRLNVFVGAVLICNPSLYNPRNTIWIGVIVCNILTLVMGLFEVWAIAWGDEEACLIFTVIMGKGQD